MCNINENDLIDVNNKQNITKEKNNKKTKEDKTKEDKNNNNMNKNNKYELPNSNGKDGYELHSNIKNQKAEQKTKDCEVSTSLNNSNSDNNIDEINNNKNDMLSYNYIEKLKIDNLDKFDSYLKSYYLKNKGISQNKFIKHGKIIYETKKLKNKFKMVSYHIKYLNQKYSKSLKSNNFSAIYDYANSFDDI